METAKERLIQLIDKQGVSHRKFCIEISISHTYFSVKGAVSSDILLKIFTIYPELNMDWVITGRGEMIIKNGAEYTGWRDKFYECLEKYNKVVEDKNGVQPLVKTA